jgi:hypothetical protein
MGSSPQTIVKDLFTTMRRDEGGLTWPVALRYLTRYDDWKELRERIDVQVEELIAQPAGRPALVDVLQALDSDVAKLQRYFAGQGEDMPTTRQQRTDARRFLRQVRSALAQVPSSTTASTSR